MKQDTINDQTIKIGCYGPKYPYNIIADETILHIYGGINRKADLTHLRGLSEEDFQELINKDDTIQKLEILVNGSPVKIISSGIDISIPGNEYQFYVEINKFGRQGENNVKIIAKDKSNNIGECYLEIINDKKELDKMAGEFLDKRNSYEGKLQRIGTREDYGSISNPIRVYSTIKNPKKTIEDAISFWTKFAGIHFQIVENKSEVERLGVGNYISIKEIKEYKQNNPLILAETNLFISEITIFPSAHKNLEVTLAHELGHILLDPNLEHLHDKDIMDTNGGMQFFLHAYKQRAAKILYKFDSGNLENGKII